MEIVFFIQSQILPILSNWEEKSIWSSKNFQQYKEVYIHQI